MSVIEKELVRYSKFKSTVGYPDRQDYLHAIVVAVSKAADKDPNGFDSLTDETAEWYDAAVRAHNRKEEVPDFDPIDDDDDEATDDAEGVADELTLDDDTGGEDLPSEDTDADPDDETAPEEAAEAEVEIEAEATAAAEVEAEAENEAQEAAEHAAKPKPKPAKKSKSKNKAAASAGPKKEPRVYDTLEKDRYGITLGTKTHDAILMYEKGCTYADVSKELGGKHYNILKSLAKEGHLFEKLEGGKVRITHKDDVGVKPAKKGKK